MSEVTSPERAAKAAAGGISLLERATKFKFSLLLMTLVLSLDLALSRAGLGGVLGADATVMRLEASIGAVIGFIAGYSLFMSAGVIVIKIIVEQLLLHTLWSWVYRLLHANRRDVPNLSRYVAAGDVRNFAIRENNSVALKVYDDAVQSHADRQSNLSQISHLSFACLVLLVLGLCLPGERGSLSQVHLLAFSEANTVAGMGAQMFCIGLWALPTPWLYRFFGDTYPLLWIEYPPLAEKSGRMRD